MGEGEFNDVHRHGAALQSLQSTVLQAQRRHQEGGGESRRAIDRRPNREFALPLPDEPRGIRCQTLRAGAATDGE